MKRFIYLPFNKIIIFFENFGRYIELMFMNFRSMSSWKIYIGFSIDHMIQIGVKSIPIVIITSLFSGMVTSVNAAYQFETGFVPNWFVGSIVGESSCFWSDFRTANPLIKGRPCLVKCLISFRSN